MSEKKDTVYSKVEITPAENSRVGIVGEVSWEHMEKYYEKSLDNFVKEVELDGFRKGNAPRDAVEAKVTQMAILQDAAQAALGDAYPAIVMDNNIRIIGYPQISITKIAHGSELGFFISSDVMPEVTLPDYKATAAKHNKEELSVEVTDADVDAQIEQMQKMYGQMMQSQEPTEGENTESEQEGEKKEQTEPEFPEINDEFVQKLGDFKTVDDFKTVLRKDIETQKTSQARDKRREDMMNEIADATEVTLPEAVIAAEQDKMLAQIKDDVTRMGMEFDAWLEHQKKTEDDVKAEIIDDAKKRATVDWLLKEIARDAEIKADTEKVDAQVETLTKQHPDAPLENIRAYVENIYVNEAVINFLEEQK